MKLESCESNKTGEVCDSHEKIDHYFLSCFTMFATILNASSFYKTFHYYESLNWPQYLVAFHMKPMSPGHARLSAGLKSAYLGYLTWVSAEAHAEVA